MISVRTVSSKLCGKVVSTIQLKAVALRLKVPDIWHAFLALPKSWRHIRVVRSHWKLVSMKIPIPYPDASKRISIEGLVPAAEFTNGVYVFWSSPQI